MKIVAPIGIRTGPKTLKKRKEKKPIHHLFPKRPKCLSLSLSFWDFKRKILDAVLGGEHKQCLSVSLSFWFLRVWESSWVGLLAMEALPSASHKTRYHILCFTKRGHFKLLDFLCFDYSVFLCVPVGSKFWTRA